MAKTKKTANNHKKRLDKAVVSYLKGVRNELQFFEQLTKDIEKGGLGLPQEKAHQIKKSIDAFKDRILNQGQSIEEVVAQYTGEKTDTAPKKNEQQEVSDLEIDRGSNPKKEPYRTTRPSPPTPKTPDKIRTESRHLNLPFGEHVTYHREELSEKELAPPSPSTESRQEITKTATPPVSKPVPKSDPKPKKEPLFFEEPKQKAPLFEKSAPSTELEPELEPEPVPKPVPQPTPQPKKEPLFFNESSKTVTPPGPKTKKTPLFEESVPSVIKSEDIKQVQKKPVMQPRTAPKELNTLIEQEAAVAALPVIGGTQAVSETQTQIHQTEPKPEKEGFLKKIWPFGKKKKKAKREQKQTQPVKQPQIQPQPTPPARAPQGMQQKKTSRPRMEDVKYEARLYSPVDELSSLTVKDFRRLSKDPEEAARKVRDKLDLMGEESLQRRAEGIAALKSSELYRAYSDIMTKSMMEGRSFTDIIAEQDQLTLDEFKVIMQLNKQLHY